jgi:hypothetical protein
MSSHPSLHRSLFRGQGLKGTVVAEALPGAHAVFVALFMDIRVVWTPGEPLEITCSLDVGIASGTVRYCAHPGVAPGPAARLRPGS